ncbi:MAG: ParB N-terminal domain-containing protein [Cyanobacteria bacterium]|nr:ParB N-terminal domain-containing protein [Cyanobacteriota bacterium]
METKQLGFTDLIPIDQIILDPEPIRKELDPDHIQDILDSLNILPMGLLDPLVVKSLSDGKYQVISGNHRYMAVKQGGWKEVPCHVIEPISDAEEFLMKLHTNTKRKNLNDLELCEALVREKEIYETFYPHTKKGRNQFTDERNAQCEQSSPVENRSFTEAKSKTLGVGASTLRRDIQIGQVVKEIPELKEAKATKMEAYAIARRKPPEKTVVQKALQASTNKPETLKQFTRHEPKQPQESEADYAYRYMKDGLRLIRRGIEWRRVCMISRLMELVEDGVLLELAKLLAQEDQRLKKTLEEIRKEYS